MVRRQSVGKSVSAGWSVGRYLDLAMQAQLCEIPLAPAHIIVVFVA